MWLRNLQLIQSHVAPSHGPPARVLSPLFSPAKSLLLPSHVAKRSTPKLRGPLSSPPIPCGPLLLTLPKLRGPLPSPKPCGPLSLWLPHLGLNPSTSLPLQPHFRLLLQSVTPTSIPEFFQLYWAAIVSPGRHVPMAWSQSSPSSHLGGVTRGSCFPITSWVEVTPISLAQSMATAI